MHVPLLSQADNLKKGFGTILWAQHWRLSYHRMDKMPRLSQAVATIILGYKVFARLWIWLDESKGAISKDSDSDSACSAANRSSFRQSSIKAQDSH